MNEYKARFARQTELRTLTEALRDADVLVGLSAKGAVTPAMLKVMAPRPIVLLWRIPIQKLIPRTHVMLATISY